jgi:hypothetical protein
LAALAFVFSERDAAEDESGFGKQAFVLGLTAFLAGGVPVWLIGKQVAGGGAFDQRFALGFLPGVSLLICALVVLLIQPRGRRWILAALLVCGIFTQVFTVNTYRREWANLRTYFWQLAWRMPNLQPGTAILAGYVPSPLLPDYDASFALALLYADQKTGQQLPYWYYTWDGLQNPNLKVDAKANKLFRNLAFEGLIGRSVMVQYQAPPGCVRVADSFYAGDPALGPQNNFLAYSDLARIEAESPHQPPQAIFGAEPARGWCYYFQKADLARQLADWPQVIKLYQEAEAAGLAPSQGGELLPLLEAYARTGAWHQVVQVSQRALKLTAELQPTLCRKWAAYTEFPGADTARLAQLRQEWGCP